MRNSNTDSDEEKADLARKGGSISLYEWSETYDWNAWNAKREQRREERISALQAAVETALDKQASEQAEPQPAVAAPGLLQRERARISGRQGMEQRTQADRDAIQRVRNLAREQLLRQDHTHRAQAAETARRAPLYPPFQCEFPVALQCEFPVALRSKAVTPPPALQAARVGTPAGSPMLVDFKNPRRIKVTRKADSTSESEEELVSPGSIELKAPATSPTPDPRMYM